MSTVLTNIRDNHTRGTVADFLRAKIHDNSHLSVVSAYFSIYAYDALKESLDRIHPTLISCSAGLSQKKTVCRVSVPCSRLFATVSTLSASRSTNSKSLTLFGL